MKQFINYVCLLALSVPLVTSCEKGGGNRLSSGTANRSAASQQSSKIGNSQAPDLSALAEEYKEKLEPKVIALYRGVKPDSVDDVILGEDYLSRCLMCHYPSNPDIKFAFTTENVSSRLQNAENVPRHHHFKHLFMKPYVDIMMRGFQRAEKRLGK